MSQRASEQLSEEKVFLWTINYFVLFCFTLFKREFINIKTLFRGEIFRQKHTGVYKAIKITKVSLWVVNN